MWDSAHIALIAAAAGSIVYGLIVLLLIVWLIAKVVRLLIRNIDAFGRTAPIKIISLAVVVWLNPRLFSGVGEGLIAFSKSISGNVPRSFGASISQFASTQDPSALIDLFSKLTETLVKAATTLISKVGLVDFLIAFGEWAALGTLLSIVFAPPAGQSGRILGGIGRISPKVGMLCALLALVIAGGLVGISSIVAVPYLRESAEATDSEKATFEAQLINDSYGKENYAEQFPEKVTEPPILTGLREKQAVDKSSTLQPLVTIVDTIRNGAHETYKDLQRTGLARQSDQRDKAVSKFNINAGRGSQERLRYAEKLRSWYRDQVGYIGGEIEDCKRRIETFDNTLKNLSTTFDQLSQPSALSRNFNIAQQAYEPLQEPLKQIAECRRSQYWQIGAPDLIPAENWGPFGTLARWLLRTGSRDLTLIAGMLGFGLLGATISTAVRKGALLDYQDQTVASDLAGVIIRGFSAAIVVFLAAMGGLAIVAASASNQPTEPNPYVLFLTCFVAAVYSEDLWLSARRRFREKAGLAADETKTQPGTPLSAAELVYIEKRTPRYHLRLVIRPDRARKP